MPENFRILCQGRWRPNQVLAQYHSEPYQLPAPHEALAISHWQTLLARNEQRLFNGALFRLENFATATEQLQLTLGHTCYRDQIYCNAHTAALVQAYGTNVLARGLGVSAVVTTCDGFLPLMRRGERVGEEPGKLDVFGGHAHPEQHLREGKPDLFAAIADEIVAELNVAAHDITENMCCGLVENLLTYKPDLVFEIGLRTTRAEIARNAAHAPEVEEVAELLFLPNELAPLQTFLTEHQLALTPSAQGTLALFAAMRSRQALSH